MNQFFLPDSTEDWELKKNYAICINRSSSYCCHCGKSASPNEETHVTVYNGLDGTSDDGCRTRFLYSCSDYIGINMQETIGRQWPHLIWVGYENDGNAFFN